jgi:hypothetical protein
LHDRAWDKHCNSRTERVRVRRRKRKRRKRRRRIERN